MPDMQTEMQKLLQAWETPEPKADMFKPTTQTSKLTFNIVRDNPGLTSIEYVSRLVAEGHKKSSVSSLLVQMVRQGLLRKDSDGKMYANVPEYTPLKSPAAFNKKAGRPKPVGRPKTFKVKASPEVETPEAPPVDAVQHIMNTISLPDAKRLYTALATYFSAS